ncbi:MAG: homocysteine S-methyltransferase family protein, partial [Phycisphaerales bacterium]|nr:homocysteine S-methyltransferase family protein [Phycisphaerales bacterium]
MTPNTASILSALTSRTILIDGAMGTQTQALDLDVESDYLNCENCTDILSLSRPDAITKIHHDYLAAGADAITTNTFGGAAHTLSEFDLQDRCFEINKASGDLARAAADKFSTDNRPRFVLGDLGPGTKLIPLGQISYDQLFASYRTSAHALIESGIDAILIETCQDLLQIKCAIAATRAAARDARRNPDDIPIMVSITIEQTGTMLLGSTIEAAIEALRPLPIATLGLNCATGPVEMVNPIRTLIEKFDRPITIMPNAGLPILVQGETIYPLKPTSFVDAMRRFLETEPVNAIGGCCG